jgi:predicted O-methyltransferase YrrM
MRLSGSTAKEAPARSNLFPEEAMKVALVQVSAYGDCLFATLVARQIKRDYPGCHLTWVIGDKFASIIDGNPHVDAVRKIVLSSREEAFSSGWEKAKNWVANQVRIGNLEKAYFTQIFPDNVRYYDGLIRTTIYGAYDKPIAGPHLPEVFLTEAENRNVAGFAQKHCLGEFKHVFLFECAPGSGQSPLTPARAEALAHALGKHHPEMVFLMSSTEPLARPSAQVVDASCLTYRENAALARHCTGLIGCNSGITWLTTSTAGKALPMLQVLTKPNGVFRWGSVAMDFRRLGLAESSVIEMAEPDDTRIISCIEKWLSESHSAARREFHEELTLTSADADNAYWFIREQYGKTAAKSAMVRFLRANGFGTIRWRVLLAEVRAKGHRIIRRVLRYAAGLRQLFRVRTVAQSLTFDEAYAFAYAEIGIIQKPEEMRWLFELVRAEQPRVVLEIGLALGGTFFLWSRAAAPDAHLIAIDTKPVGRLGMWSPFSLVRRAFAVSSQRITLLFDSDSHSDTTRQRIAALLKGRMVDLLFIDGDHSREGVWQDFDMYSPFVAPGGIIAFHDISPNPKECTQGVARFWQEFTSKYETEECVLGGEPGYGIGIYRVRGSHRSTSPTASGNRGDD